MKFSDPDFDFDPSYVRMMEARPVSDYSVVDWMNILARYCSLGTFEEVEPIIPYALKLIEDRRDGCFDVFSSLLDWVQGWDERLFLSGKIEEVFRRMINVIKVSLSNFVVIQKEYTTFPKDGGMVNAAFLRANQYLRWRNAIGSLGVGNSIPTTFVEAAWVLEIECLVRAGWMKKYNPFLNDSNRQIIVDCAYDIVLQKILASKDEILCRYLTDKIQASYIGV